MLLTHYQAGARGTAVYPTHHGIDYTAHGLASEAGEVCEVLLEVIRTTPTILTATSPLPPGHPAGAKVADELGDVLWYAALCAHEQRLALDYDLADPPTANDGPAQAVLLLASTTGYYSGRVKKRLRDGAHTIPDTIIHGALIDVLHALAGVATAFGLNLADAAHANLDKLAARASRGTLTGDGNDR